jgi:hypothetical protein
MKYGTYGVFELPEGVVLRHQEPRALEALTAGYETVALDHTVVETMNGHRASGFQWLGTKCATRPRRAGDR